MIRSLENGKRSEHTYVNSALQEYMDDVSAQKIDIGLLH